MGSILEWVVLSEEDTKMLLSKTHVQECKLEFGKVLDLKHGLGLEDPASLDLYFKAFLFARQRDYSPRRISTLLSILCKVHEESMEDSWTKEWSFQYFTKLLVQHCVQRPPFSVGVFTPSQAEKIVEWITRVYYTQYKIYQGVSGPCIELTLTTQAVDEFVERPSKPRPLNEAEMETNHQELNNVWLSCVTSMIC